jgi:hypothetical protein
MTAVGTTEICIPFAPLEHQLRLAAHMRGLKFPYLQWQDHEGKTDVGGLMEAWQQTEDTQESS